MNTLEHESAPSPLTIYTVDDYEFVVAASPRDAQATWMRLTGIPADSAYLENQWVPLALDAKFVYHYEEDDIALCERLTVGEYVEKYGTDFYATTEF